MRGVREAQEALLLSRYYMPGADTAARRCALRGAEAVSSLLARQPAATLANYRRATTTYFFCRQLYYRLPLMRCSPSR